MANKQICYLLFIQVLILLLLYAGFALWGALILDAAQFPVALLRQATLTGLLAGGLFVFSTLGAAPGLLKPLFYAWVICMVLIVAALLLNVAALFRVLYTFQSALILIFVVRLAWAMPGWGPIPAVWAGGMAAYALLGFVVGEGCFIAGDCPPTALFISWLGLHGALTIAACALGFWLMHRFSHISPAWGSLGLKVMTGWLVIAAFLLALLAFDHTLPSLLRPLGLFFVALAYVVYGAHSYRALSDQNGTRTLAPHWYSLGLLLLMATAGAWGGLRADPALTVWLGHPAVIDVQVRLLWWALVCICLGVINQAVAEMRAQLQGESRRITGLMPFWLVAFGVIGGQGADGVAALLQVTLMLAGTGIIETHDLLRPWYRLGAFGHVLVLLGVILYGAGFWARRLRWHDD